MVQTSIKKNMDISREFGLDYHDNLIRRNIMDYIVAWIVAYYEQKIEHETPKVRN